MKKVLVASLLLLLLAGCGNSKSEEIRGVWISYIELSQWLDNADEEKFTQKVVEAYDNLKELGINTVYVHASAFTDAFYDSGIYPSSYYIDQSLGGKLDYDPYKILIAEARKRNFRFEAWINPLRSYSSGQVEGLAGEYLIKEWIDSGSDNVSEYKGRYYLNPGKQESIDLVCSVVEEILHKYDVDGIHMDDYFYPEGIGDDFDQLVFMESGMSDRAEFRISNTNHLVKSIYQTVKNIDSKVTLSISPAGNIPNNKSLVYADVEEWVTNSGYLDYIIPQVYWGYEHTRVPFQSVIEDWQSLVTAKDVKLVIGLGAYRYHDESAGEEWTQADLLARQVASSRQLDNYHGFVIFSYQSLFPGDDNAFIEEVRGQLKTVLE